MEEYICKKEKGIGHFLLASTFYYLIKNEKAYRRINESPLVEHVQTCDSCRNYLTNLVYQINQKYRFHGLKKWSVRTIEVAKNFGIEIQNNGKKN